MSEGSKPASVMTRRDLEGRTRGPTPFVTWSRLICIGLPWDVTAWLFAIKGTHRPRVLQEAHT